MLSILLTIEEAREIINDDVVGWSVLNSRLEIYQGIKNYFCKSYHKRESDGKVFSFVYSRDFGETDFKNVLENCIKGYCAIEVEEKEVTVNQYVNIKD